MTEKGGHSLLIGLGTRVRLASLHSRLGMMFLPVPSGRLVIVGSIFPLILHWVLSVGFFIPLNLIDVSGVVKVSLYPSILVRIHRQIERAIALSLFDSVGTEEHFDPPVYAFRLC